MELFTFRELADIDTDIENEEWTSEDLFELISDLEDDDIEEVVEEILYITDAIQEDETKDSYLKYVDSLIKSLSKEDIMHVTELVLQIIEEDEEYMLDEKMSNQAKLKSRKMRKKPAYKKSQRLKKRCKKRFAEKLKKTKNTNIPYVCGVDGKLHKGMAKKDRRVLKKKRKRNKHKIIK